MKAEIYSLIDKSLNPKALDKKMSSVTNVLREADIEILYKTDLQPDKIKLLEALRQSYSTDEGIQLIIIANALDGTSNCDVLQLFKKLCPKHTERRAKNVLPDDDDVSAENISEYKNKGDLEELATEYEIDTKAVRNGAAKKQKKDTHGKGNSKKKSNKKQESASKVVNEIWSTGDLGKGYEGCFIMYDEKLVIALPKESLTKVPTADMIIAGAKKATSARGITTGNLVSGKFTDHFDYYTIGQEDYQPKKKNAFVANFIPCAGDKPLEVVRKIVLIAASLTFIVTAVILCKLLFIDPAKVEDNFDYLRDIIHSSEVDTDKRTDTETDELDRFAKLQAINPDIKGWIYIPNTTYIDYPVLEYKGDGPYSQYYLYRDYMKNNSNYGSVFLDYRCTKSINSKNIILHGHNMDNGMVFHQLLDYANINFYASSPVIQFDTAEYNADWKIISVFKTNTLPAHGEFFNYLIGEFSSETEFMDYVYNVRERSLIDTPVTVNENDQLLTLSTCSYEFTDFRTVIVARRVRKDEKSEVNVSEARTNPDAVWPQCYYARNGGTRKELTDFVTACRAGETPWYDGDYKLDKHDIRKDTDTDTETDTETETDEEEEESQEEESSEEESSEEESSRDESSRQEEPSSSEEESFYEPEPPSSEPEPPSSEPDPSSYEEPSSSEEDSSWYEPEPSSSEPDPIPIPEPDIGGGDVVNYNAGFARSVSGRFAKYFDTSTRHEA